MRTVGFMLAGRTSLLRSVVIRPTQLAAPMTVDLELFDPSYPATSKRG